MKNYLPPLIIMMSMPLVHSHDSDALYIQANNYMTLSNTK